MPSLAPMRSEHRLHPYAGRLGNGKHSKPAKPLGQYAKPHKTLHSHLNIACHCTKVLSPVA